MAIYHAIMCVLILNELAVLFGIEWNARKRR